ncbi:MAG TPA: hypothetical protein VME69_16965 [Methylocella sp.]|nr:hypothetical protein [Methylocella sp.]
MTEPTSILVVGVDETASAVARMLLLSGYSVAIHQAVPPRVLRRKMAFGDAWYDGSAILDSVPARRADQTADFLIGLRSRSFIPVLTQPFTEVVDRWPFDVIVDARIDAEARHERVKNHAELTIILGPGAIAGTDCDLVIEISGPNIGGIIESGSARTPSSHESEKNQEASHFVHAPESGVFTTGKIIGEMIRMGEVLGRIGAKLVLAPADGRIKGLERSKQAVLTGVIVAETATDPKAQVNGCSNANQSIARGVVYAVEMTFADWTPVSLKKFT